MTAADDLAGPTLTNEIVIELSVKRDGKRLFYLDHDAFSGVVQEGQGLQSRYLPAIQEKARTLDAGKVLSLVRGA